MNKKIISIMVTLTMIFLLIWALPANAETSGICGENVTWKIDNGVLTISGTGRMNNYSGPNDIPWGSVVGDVTDIVIEDGVTYIGNNAFCWAIADMNGEVNVKTITIPKSVKEMGVCTFAYVTDVDTVYYNAEDCKFSGNSLNFAYNYFPRGKNLVIGKDVKNIGANVFYRAIGFNANQNTYTSVKYEGSEADWKNVTIEREGNEVLQYISFSDNSAEEKQIRILINNKFLSTDQPPVLINDRTMVPLRAIFEALGATVDWNDTEKSVTAKKNDATVYMQIGNNTITVDGNNVELDVPAQIVNDRTMVPVRAVAEAFDCQVAWNGYRKYVLITPNNQQPYKIEAVTDNGEVAGTAKFDEKGRLYEIQGDDTQWFAPLCMNINGNAFVADLKWLYYKFMRNENPIQISYNDEGNVSAINCGSSSEKYDAYNNGIYMEKVSNYGSTKCTYTDNKCMLGAAPVHADAPDSYTFNSMGLVEKYAFFSSGHWVRGFEYDNDGRMIKETYNGGGNQTTTYEYDTDGRLASATHYEPLSPDYNGSVTYRYINE